MVAKNGNQWPMKLRQPAATSPHRPSSPKARRVKGSETMGFKKLYMFSGGMYKVYLQAFMCSCFCGFWEDRQSEVYLCAYVCVFSDGAGGGWCKQGGGCPVAIEGAIVAWWQWLLFA